MAAQHAAAVSRRVAPACGPGWLRLRYETQPLRPGLDIRKIEDYCLNPSHPRGRHKARVFSDALDLQHSDASWLRDALLEAARFGEAFQIGEDAWGNYWRLDAIIRRQGKSAVIRTIWIVRTGESMPRFVSCWVL
jgi:hypothetical protein